MTKHSLSVTIFDLIGWKWLNYSTHRSIHAFVTDRARRVQCVRKRVCKMQDIESLGKAEQQLISPFAAMLMQARSPLHLHPNCVSIRGCIPFHLQAIHLVIVEFGSQVRYFEPEEREEGG